MNIISAGVLEVTIALLAVSICVTIPISILYTKLVRRIERSRKRKPNRGAPPSGTPVSSKPEKGFVDIVMREEFFRNTRVFDHHKIDLFQGFECEEVEPSASICLKVDRVEVFVRLCKETGMLEMERAEVSLSRLEKDEQQREAPSRSPNQERWRSWVKYPPNQPS